MVFIIYRGLTRFFIPYGRVCLIFWILQSSITSILNEKQLYISIITELELLAFKGITAKEEKVVNEFVSQCKTINITSEVKQNTIKIRKKYNTKLPDSIIMARIAPCHFGCRI